MDQPLIAYPPYVHKPTALIHFERELSVVAQKVMTLIIAHCQKSPKNAQSFYFVEKRKVCEFLGWEDSHNQQRVIEAFQEIYNNNIVWNLFGQDRMFNRMQCRLIIALLEPAETGASVGFRLYPELEPVILSPKVYGQILFEAPALLARSEYAFPLYELLADHISRENGGLRVSLADLKRYLGLKGRYSIYSSFVEWVLTPSIESINAHTDIQVAYETWKTGRAISGFLFRIQRRERTEQHPAITFCMVENPVAVLEIPVAGLASVRSTEEQALLDRLVQHQISEEDAVQALRAHGLGGVREIFGFVRQEVMRRKGTPEEIRNAPAYLARCLREGFGRKQQSGRSEVDLVVERAVQVVVREKAEAAKTEQAAQQAIVQAWFSALPVSEQADLELRFLQAEPVWSGVAASSRLRGIAFRAWLAKSGLFPCPAPHE